jgi:hypothetical protein
MTTNILEVVQVEPIWEKRHIGGVAPICAKVHVEGEEYARCFPLTRGYWNVTGKTENEYQAGLIKGFSDIRQDDLPKDTNFANAVGKIGETAFAKMCGLTVDFSVIATGDKQDYMIDQASMDLKTAH